MLQHDAAADCETQAGAPRLARQRVADLPETLENNVSILRVYPGAVVRNVQLDRLCIAPHAQGNPALPGWRKFCGIAQQVDNHLNQPIAISNRPHGLIVDIER
jgi:hypothetical protein